MPGEDMQAELERLRAENEALKAKTKGSTSIRVSEKDVADLLSFIESRSRAMAAAARTAAGAAR